MFLGLMHLAFTYFGDKLHPNNSALLAQLKSTHPVISRQTRNHRGEILVAAKGFNQPECVSTRFLRY